MARYGLFQAGAKEPWQTFDGDRIAQSNEYVYIYKGQSMENERQVAAIKLGDGQCVKELEESQGRGGTYVNAR